MTQPTPFNLHPNVYTQKELRYYLFAVELDGFVGNCHIFYNLSNKLYVLYKAEDLNLSTFNMVTEINEWKL